MRHWRKDLGLRSPNPRELAACEPLSVNLRLTRVTAPCSLTYNTSGSSASGSNTLHSRTHHHHFETSRPTLSAAFAPANASPAREKSLSLERQFPIGGQLLMEA